MSAYRKEPRRALRKENLEMPEGCLGLRRWYRRKKCSECSKTAALCVFFWLPRSMKSMWKLKVPKFSIVVPIVVCRPEIAKSAAETGEISRRQGQGSCRPGRRRTRAATSLHHGTRSNVCAHATKGVLHHHITLASTE